MKRTRFLLTLSIALLVTLVADVAWALPQFTGDAPDDFVAANVVRIDDPPGSPDVGMPNNAPPGVISGWDMKAVYFDYESSTDVMYIGIDTYGICGDADGDGDPSATASWLSANGGVDTADFSGSEDVGILIDTDNNSSTGGDGFEVVVGVDMYHDISSLGAYNFTGNAYGPAFGFGSKLTNDVEFYNTGPDASAPDLEFSIANFSELPGFTFTPGDAFQFHVRAFTGSGDDDGVGEDFIGPQYPDLGFLVSFGTTSSGIDLRAYQAAEGIYVEFVAYDVEEDGTIRLALLGEDGAAIWTGEVDVVAGPQFVARLLVPGLEAGKSYDFAVTDEVGQGWAAPGIVVGTFETEMASLSRTSLALSFDSLPQREYEIQWTPAIGSPWQAVKTLVAEGNHTRVVVDYPNPEDPTGFFRVQQK